MGQKTLGNMRSILTYSLIMQWLPILYTFIRMQNVRWIPAQIGERGWMGGLHLQFSSLLLPRFLHHFLTSRRFGFGIGVHLESGRVVWRSVISQFTYLVRLNTSGGSDLRYQIKSPGCVLYLLVLQNVGCRLITSIMSILSFSFFLSFLFDITRCK